MATIKDVAKRASVSVGTVSKVINNIAVKPKTKIAVEEAIKALNYEPNTYARGLKVNKTNTVALILPTIWHPYFSELAYHIERELSKNELKLLLCNSEGDYVKELEYIILAKQNRVDGIIAITYSDIDSGVSSNLPLISIDRKINEESCYVSSDNFEGGRLAAKHLVESGCQKLCIIGEVSKKVSSTRDRKKGFIDYCEQHQIPYEMFYNVGKKGTFVKDLEQFLLEHLVQQKSFDGIFSITDMYAHNIIDVLKKYDMTMPNDVQLVGFDGSKASANEQILISTIRQPIEEIAKTSVTMLIDLINEEPVEKQAILPVKLIKGYTTKA